MTANSLNISKSRRVGQILNQCLKCKKNCCKCFRTGTRDIQERREQRGSPAGGSEKLPGTMQSQN